MDDVKTMGRIAYEAHSEALDGYDSEAWEDLTSTVTAAWEAAAEAVMGECSEQLPEGWRTIIIREGSSSITWSWLKDVEADSEYIEMVMACVHRVLTKSEM